MKFGDFLLPQSLTPDSDFTAIDEALREARLCDELGYDVLWLTEHHFSGESIYVDPATFAAAVAVQTTRIKVGFAVAQVALHHPVRLAEQVALIDNISRGRVIAGIGRGTRAQFYEYRGYGISPQEAQDRLLEAEEILLSIWTASDYRHHGKYWQIELPVLRPQVYQKPHPPIVRACATLDSTLEMARQGRPFLMTISSNETTQQRLDLYRQTMSETGYDEETIARNMQDTWALRNIVVAETDAEAQAVGVPALKSWLEEGGRRSRRLNTPDDEAYIEAHRLRGGETRPDLLIHGSPATVSEELEKLQRTGIGGLIIRFRVGSMPWEATENSLRLFAQKVAPTFQAPVAG